MKELILSKRMEAVVDMVPPQSHTACDVGCDHAYVSIKLIKNDIAKRVIAMDVREGPLEIARQNIRTYGMEDDIELRLSDGLMGLAPMEADVIIMAGMGGLLIKGILERGDGILTCKAPPVLILQPQSDIREVRIFLYSHAYHIVRERMVFEEGKYYTVLQAAYGAEPGYRNEEDWLYGRYNIENRDEVLIRYLEKEFDTLERIYQSLENAGQERMGEASEEANVNRLSGRMKEIREKINDNRAAYKRCRDEM